MDRAKIIWNQAEWQRLAARAAVLFHGGMSPLDAFRAVQADVFKNEKWRIRNLSSTWAVRNGIPYLEVAVGEIEKTGPGTPAPAPAAAPKPNGAIPAWMEAQIEAEADREAERLRGLFAAKVAERVREKLGSPVPAAPIPEPVAAPVAPSAIERADRDESVLRQQQGQPRRHNPEMQADGSNAKPKVVIVGLWPSIRAEINTEFHEVLDLRFFENEKRDLAVMQRHARNAALVVCFEKVGHDIQQCLRAEAKVRFEVTHGGSKHLLDRLTRFAVDGK